MRYAHIFLTVILLVFLPAVTVANGDVQLMGDHFIPLDPEEGDTVTFFVLVLDENDTGVRSVDLDIDGKKHVMEPYFGPLDDPTSKGTIYFCQVTMEESGTFNTTYIALLSNDTAIFNEGHQIFINGSAGNEADTILGLPKTYCAISVLFITFIVIFLTWSYFKGRRMQKEVEASTGSSKIACSACGAPISMDDEKCPKCGAEFEEEEHICGNCGAVISEKDQRCRKCGVKLKGPDPDKEPVKKKKKEDPDLKKLGRKVDMTGKVKCRKCGTVYLKKEGSCPECSEK
ncbi:MAG: zinc ribbon domain-containing protein [Thermoplasmatota archaeon]